MIVTSEQPFSAHRSLAGAGIRYGEVTEVAIALGVMPVGGGSQGTHFAFCSAWSRRGRIIQRAPWYERNLPIDGEIVFSNGDEIAQALYGKKGVAVLLGYVQAKEKVTFSIRRDLIRFAQLSDADTMNIRSAFGQTVSRKLLEQVPLVLNA